MDFFLLILISSWSPFGGPWPYVFSPVFILIFFHLMLSFSLLSSNSWIQLIILSVMSTVVWFSMILIPCEVSLSLLSYCSSMIFVTFSVISSGAAYFLNIFNAFNAFCSFFFLCYFRIRYALAFVVIKDQVQVNLLRWNHTSKYSSVHGK